MSKGESEFEQEPRKEVKDAKTFNELYEIVDNKGGVAGSKGKIYTSEILKGIIEKCRPKWDDVMPPTNEMIDPLSQMSNLQGKLNSITREEGLRDKVSELLYKEIEGKNEEQVKIYKMIRDRKNKSKGS